MAKDTFNKIFIAIGLVALIVLASTESPGEQAAMNEAAYESPEFVESEPSYTENVSEPALPIKEKPAYVEVPTYESSSYADKEKVTCHPNYSGCLNPDASDYDCAGGSGNGPHYTGPVRVIGPDVFGLDRDGDGWGCE